MNSRELDLDTLPLEAADRETAVRLVQRPPEGALVLVEGPAARVLAKALADRWTGPRDVTVLEPPTGRWTAADVRELIVAAAARRPDDRHAIVVTAGATLTSALYDRLLKLFEEPPAPAWFLVCLPDAAAVPPAIRGRAAAVLSARPAAAAERVDALARSGMDPDRAARVVAACHGHVELEAAAAAAPALLEPLEELAEVRAGGPRPLTRAHEVQQTVDAIADVLADVVGSRAAAQRTVVTLLLDRWSAQASGVLRSDTAGADAVAVVERFLTATGRARAALERNVSASAVLGTVMSQA